MRVQKWLMDLILSAHGMVFLSQLTNLMHQYNTPNPSYLPCACASMVGYICECKFNAPIQTESELTNLVYNLAYI